MSQKVFMLLIPISCQKSVPLCRLPVKLQQQIQRLYSLIHSPNGINLRIWQDMQWQMFGYGFNRFPLRYFYIIGGKKQSNHFIALFGKQPCSNEISSEVERAGMTHASYGHRWPHLGQRNLPTRLPSKQHMAYGRYPRFRHLNQSLLLNNQEIPVGLSSST